MLAKSPCQSSDQVILASVVTAPGRGAVATISVQGFLEQLADAVKTSQQPFFQPRNQKTIHQQTIGKIIFGAWGDEELVVCRKAENEFEIHCHGGQAAISRILSDLQNVGVTIVDWKQYLSHSVSIWKADYQIAISQAQTFRAAELLLHQCQIGADVWLELEKCLAPDYWNQLAPEKRKCYQKTIQQMQHWLDFASHVVSPWKVVVGGVPNAGKSSLINAILGYERAIVVDQPGTTRDVVSGETAIDGWAVQFSDTAGQRETVDTLEAAGIERAIDAMQKAGLQILLLDRAASPSQQTKILLKTFPNALLVFNKIDHPKHPGWEHIKFSHPPVAVSCQTGAGIESLLKTIIQNLIPTPPTASVILPITQRQQNLLGRLIALGTVASIGGKQ